MSFALSPFRVVTGLVFASVISLFAAAGCSQQAEGERCDKAKNGDADCDSGLICVPAADLLEKSADRCCHPSTTDQGDNRCTRGNETSNPPPVTGSSGAGGAAGSDSGGAPDQGGTAGMSQGGGGTSGGGTGGSASGASGSPAEGGASGGSNESGGAGAGGAP